MNYPKRPVIKQRRSKKTVKTASGKTFRLHQSIADRVRARKRDRATRKAVYLSTLPKERWKRLAYRMHPKRLAKYWFSREGGIMALKITGVGVVVMFFLIVGLFAYFRKDLPKIGNLNTTKLGGSITYYDRTGKTVLWQDYGAVKQIPVQSEQISDNMKNATVAIEDKSFYHEGAFNVKGILRAGVHDVFGAGGAVQGGSTITQQLVKLNENWTSKRNVANKVKELILAVELEREYSKDAILTGYLNVAPYGGVEYGVETAARDYFGVSAKDLTLPQAAMLAAIPQDPPYYSPYSDPQYNTAAQSDYFNSTALLNRQHYILDQMAEQHMITQKQADAAKKVDVLAMVRPLQAQYQGITAPYFVLSAKQELQNTYGASTVNRGGWKVITTLDVNAQKIAEKEVADNRANVERFGGDEEAMVAEDVPTGQIVALVGGVDFSDPDHGQVNYASQALIPPGSSFKPYDYATLINNSNAGAGSVLYDAMGPIMDPKTGAGYPCTDKTRPSVDNPSDPDGSQKCLWDYDFNFPGPVTLRYALAGSRNVPAVKAMIQAGVSKTISTASAMMDNTMDQKKHKNSYNCYKPGSNMSDPSPADLSPCYPSSAIGDGAFLHLDDHVNGLATLARMGNAIPRTYILQITDSNGKVIQKWQQPKGQQVIKPDTAYIVNSMLSDPNATYLPYGYKFQHYKGWNFAVKTGTTNDNFDGLMTSWSTKYAVVSWVGYHTRNKALTRGEMEYLTEPLTRGFMEKATDALNTKPVNWVQPSDIKVLPAYVVRNHVGLGSVEPSPSTDIFPSWYQPKSGSANQTIDKVSNKLATSCTPDLAKQVANNSNANPFSIDQFVNGGYTGTNVTATDDVHNCNDSPPGTPTITLNGTCTAGSTCNFTVTFDHGTHLLNDPNYPNFPGTVNLLDSNGKQLATANASDRQCTGTTTSDSCSVQVSYTPSDSGTINLTAQVIDSVLYSSTGPGSVDVQPGVSTTSLSFTSAHTSGNKTVFSWVGGTGPYTVTRAGNGDVLCPPTSDTSCTYHSSLPDSTGVEVSDSNGDSSSTTVSH